MKTIKQNDKIITTVVLDTEVEDIGSQLDSVQAVLLHDDTLFSELRVRQSGDKTFEGSRIVPSDAPIGKHTVEWRFMFKDQSEPMIETQEIEIVRDVKSEVSVKSKNMVEESIPDSNKYEMLPKDMINLLQERV